MAARTVVKLILCQALIKGPKWDWLVEKACEVGVSQPRSTCHSPHGCQTFTRGPAQERWKRIAARRIQTMRPFRPHGNG